MFYEELIKKMMDESIEEMRKKGEWFDYERVGDRLIITGAGMRLNVPFEEFDKLFKQETEKLFQRKR